MQGRSKHHTTKMSNGSFSITVFTIQRSKRFASFSIAAQNFKESHWTVSCYKMSRLDESTTTTATATTTSTDEVSTPQNRNNGWHRKYVLPSADTRRATTLRSIPLVGGWKCSKRDPTVRNVRSHFRWHFFSQPRKLHTLKGCIQRWGWVWWLSILCRRLVEINERWKIEYQTH